MLTDDDAGEGPGNDDQFAQALADVAEGRGPSSSNLAGLSHLLPEQQARFRAAWQSLGERERLALIDTLHREEAEALRLDFNVVYRLGMADDSGEVRRRAIEAVVEDDSEALLDLLLDRVVRDDEPEVRTVAARALGPFAQRAELGDLPTKTTDRVQRTLLETVHRPGERIDVRAAALASVGYLSADPVRDELAVGAADDELRLDALRAMGHSADARWLSTLTGYFDDPDDALRQAAATAAGEIGDEVAVPGLTELIDDPAQPVRLAAIAALGEIGGGEARDALIYALEDKRESVRAAAAAALEELDFFEDPLGT